MVVGPELLRQTTKKVKLIQGRMKASQSRQKSYADKRRRPLEFALGDHLCGKGNPLEEILRKYVLDPSQVLEVEDLQIRGDLSVEVQPVGLGDIQTRQLRGKSISLV
ncbi:uncharacterized protein LOC114174437 [Vigna unguiculata]|uniref:uncharacterized protein LOC114174437 n=1 Tax=Vigna unguiculata TaxID=3917 RepID=UPI00101682F3|nr:uncharacterized protein LOC114174437 [Vigna unguiculata]